VAAILAVRGLSKKFGDLTAVDNVTFDVREGEIFSLLGPNGAGKTTTISMLCTLFAPTDGEASIGGLSITSDRMAVRRLIGVVPQELALYDELSGRENLAFWGRMYGMRGAALRERIQEVLSLIGLADRARHRVKTYSGGMKRRVNIGVGLLHKPRLLFLDEPTVGIDPQSRRAILEAVKDLNRQGMSVLYTTHYMEEAEELSHRVGIIDHGKLIALGTQEELTRQVGHQDMLVLHVDDEQAATALSAALGVLPGVARVRPTEHSVIAMTPAAKELLSPAVSAANHIAVKIRSIEIQEPNLESVFLHLTGRALRD
jgi:ABC-2 type transport system ATP-binding protein